MSNIFDDVLGDVFGNESKHQSTEQRVAEQFAKQCGLTDPVLTQHFIHTFQKSALQRRLGRPVSIDCTPL